LKSGELKWLVLEKKERGMVHNGTKI